ncbi:MAG: MGMT family protein [Candidatus Margulisiibacteriota bacterium]|jgi:O-6-methylguanine DNA methyltransferase
MKLTHFAEKVYNTLRNSVPKGKVVTYGQLAIMAGFPGAARAVGNVLHINPFAPDVPCHRVVDRHGILARKFGAPGGINAQKQKLSAEGISFMDKYQVKMKEHCIG